MSPRELRIDDALGKASITIEPVEDPEELRERLRREESAHKFEIVKNYSLLFVFLAVVISIGAISTYDVAIDTAANPDTKRWAQTVLSSLCTGGLSFLAGLAIAKKPR